MSHKIFLREHQFYIWALKSGLKSIDRQLIRDECLFHQEPAGWMTHYFGLPAVLLGSAVGLILHFHFPFSLFIFCFSFNLFLSSQFLLSFLSVFHLSALLLFPLSTSALPCLTLPCFNYNFNWLFSTPIINVKASTGTFSSVRSNLVGSAFLPHVNSSLHVYTFSFLWQQWQLPLMPLQMCYNRLIIILIILPQ